MWLDGIYMAAPFYAEFVAMLLLYHAWDPVGNNRGRSILKPGARRISGAGPWAGLPWPWWMCSIISLNIIPNGPTFSLSSGT